MSRSSLPVLYPWGCRGRRSYWAALRFWALIGVLVALAIVPVLVLVRVRVIAHVYYSAYYIRRTLVRGPASLPCLGFSRCAADGRDASGVSQKLAGAGKGRRPQDCDPAPANC